MFKRIQVICCLLLLSITQWGCIGLIVRTPAECANETPYTGVHDYNGPRQRAGKVSTTGRMFPEVKTPKNSTKAEFLKDWGKADDINIVSENEEIWIYKRKLWCGVIPVLILPIPLILPVCDGFDRIEFRGDEGVRLHTRHIVEAGGILAGSELIADPDPACRFPLPANRDVDSDASKQEAAPVTPCTLRYYTPPLSYF